MLKEFPISACPKINNAFLISKGLRKSTAGQKALKENFENVKTESEEIDSKSVASQP